MPDDYNPLTELLGGDDVLNAIVGSALQQGQFKNKELDQQWRIAQLQDSGLNKRAGISANAATKSAGISANASMANAKLNASTQRYGIDVDRQSALDKIALDRELGRGQIGSDLLKTAASLQGPSDYIDYVNLLRGGRQLGGMPYFLGGLTGNTPMADFQAPGGSPSPLTMDSLLNGLGANGNGGTTSDGGTMSAQEQQANQFKTNVNGLLSGGINQFNPGSLERLNPSELGLLQGAARESGWDFNDLVKQYQNAQVKQGSATAY